MQTGHCLAPHRLLLNALCAAESVQEAAIRAKEATRVPSCAGGSQIAPHLDDSVTQSLGLGCGE